MRNFFKDSIEEEVSEDGEELLVTFPVGKKKRQHRDLLFCGIFYNEDTKVCTYIKKDGHNFFAFGH